MPLPGTSFLPSSVCALFILFSSGVAWPRPRNPMRRWECTGITQPTSHLAWRPSSFWFVLLIYFCSWVENFVFCQTKVKALLLLSFPSMSFLGSLVGELKLFLFVDLNGGLRALPGMLFDCFVCTVCFLAYCMPSFVALCPFGLFVPLVFFCCTLSLSLRLLCA